MKIALASLLSGMLTSSVFGFEWQVIPPERSDQTIGTYNNIQAAVNAAQNGDTIIVHSNRWVLSAPIVVTNNITIRSLNGPKDTIVHGNGSVRCFDLGNTATVLDGFTIAGSYTSGNGGGVLCTTNSPALVINSIITSNTAVFGGGMFGGTARNCVFFGNMAQGAVNSSGGGLHSVTAINCTLSGNMAYGLGGSGAQNSTVINSIVDNDTGGSQLIHSFAWNGGPGNGNITTSPQFVNSQAMDFRLQTGSPGIDAGSNDYVEESLDLIGNPRLFNGTVDMGAYEYVDSDGDGLRNEDESGIHGTSPNHADTDGDGFDDGFEVALGINPTVYDGELVGYVQQHGDRFGLYPSNAVLDVAVDQLLLGITNGEAVLRLQLQQTTDLVTWTNIGSAVEWSAGTPTGAIYYRVRAGGD